MKKNIYGMTFPALEAYFSERGENTAKAKIIYNSIYKKHISDFSELLQLGAKTKAMLNSDFIFGGVEILTVQNSPGAVKFLFGLESREFDSLRVEAVLMRHDYGNALCVSTQVGCNMNCAFCQSGLMKKTRDLLPSEMVLQLIRAEETLGEKIIRVTIMGIGEPLDNFENVMDFINIIGHRHGLDIAPRHITLSTCAAFSPERLRLLYSAPCNIAVSLNAPNNEIRTRVMPVNKAYGIEGIINFAREYQSVKRKKITFEYVMLGGVNDSVENALELAELIGGINCYVNLIPYNETNLGFRRSSEERVKSFYDILIQNKIRAVMRREFGGEIQAACGQLTSAENIKKAERKFRRT